jgi:BMFP domain-containing protein YqiC
VEAHRAQLAGARERAGALRGQVEELESYLAQDPAAAAAGE